ncbi:hypothetical protein Q7689_20840 [Nocardiopsis tropica]|nr:hypothetical protein [Nocardiopsis tropica]
MLAWTYRHWAVAAAATLGALVLLGVPTVLVPNGFFTREIEPTWWSYPVWGAGAVLSGLLAATYVGRGGEREGNTRGGLGGVVLTWLAIGCPVCNKLVLLALGASGALAWFAPLQPVLAVAGLALLAVALRARLRTAGSCPLPPPGG